MSRTIEAINTAIKVSAEKSTFIGRWVTDEEKEAIVFLRTAMKRLSAITSHLPEYGDENWVEGLEPADRALVLFMSITMTAEPMLLLAYITTLPSGLRPAVEALAYQYFILMAATEYGAERRYRLRRAAEVVSGKEIPVKAHEIYMMAKACGIGPQYPVI